MQKVTKTCHNCANGETIKCPLEKVDVTAKIINCNNWEGKNANPDKK